MAAAARVGRPVAKGASKAAAKGPEPRLTPSAKAHAKADATARRAGDLLDRLSIEAGDGEVGGWGGVDG